jgi:biopolymer transport protein ExbB
MTTKPLLFLFALALPISAVAQEINFSAQIAEGGVAILVIIALSVLALAVAIERAIHFRKKFIAPDSLLERVRPLWNAGEFVQLQALLAQENNTLARIISYMVTHRQQNFALVSSGVGDIASMELRHHQQKAYALAIVATVAPIVGLLGTVIGMIEAFHVIAYSEGMGNPALLAGGISKALVNTASGLSVALPALGLHHFFKNRAAFLGLALEQQVNQLLNEWFIPAVNSTPNLQVVGHAH